MQDALDQLRAIRLGEQCPQRQQLIQGHAQCIDVAPRLRAAIEPLRRHEAHGADDVAGLGQSVFSLERLGQAEIGDPDVSPGVEQEVGGLDVAVEYALLVGVGQGFGDLAADAGDRAEVDGVGAIG